MQNINPADQMVADMIEALSNAHRRTFKSETAKRAELISQIAELRASMNPTCKCNPDTKIYI